MTSSEPFGLGPVHRFGFGPVQPFGLGPVRDRVARAVLGGADGIEGPETLPIISKAEAEELRRLLRERMRPALMSLAPELTDPLRLDRYRLSSVMGCPASWSYRAQFAWTAQRASRLLGRASLGYEWESGGGLLGATRWAVGQAISDGYGLGPWLASLGPGGRAAVMAEAVSWAARVVAVVPRALLGEVRVAHGDPKVPVKEGGRVDLVGRADLVATPAGGDGRSVSIVVGRVDSTTMGLDGLAASLTGARHPSRVVTVDPANGEVGHFDVTMAGMVEMIEVVGVALDSLVPTRSYRPGAHCYWCDGRDDCSVGVDWMAGQTRRIGGIAVFPVGSG